MSIFVKNRKNRSAKKNAVRSAAISARNSAKKIGKERKAQRTAQKTASREKRLKTATPRRPKKPNKAQLFNGIAAQRCDPVFFLK